MNISEYTIDIRAENPIPEINKLIDKMGFAVLKDVFSLQEVKEIKDKMYKIEGPMKDDLKRILEANDNLSASKSIDSGNNFVMRLMMKYDISFSDLLKHNDFLKIVDNTLGKTSVLHLQNGFIMPKQKEENTLNKQEPFFHMDFPRILNGYVSSINIVMLISNFSLDNGGTILIPRSHQGNVAKEDIKSHEAISVEASAGSWLIFDSTLLHAAGENSTDEDRIAINHQLTRSYFKQQIDYSKALEHKMSSLHPRVQQLLGSCVRVPSSLEEFYLPVDKRLYKPNQG